MVPIMLTHERVHCALCGADDTQRVLTSGGHKGYYVYQEGRQLPVAGVELLVRCRRCGLVYVNPQRRLEEGLTTYPASEELAYFSYTHATRLVGAARLLARLEALLPGRGRLLDIGCGDGALLTVATERGWNVTGIEASARLVAALNAGALAGRVALGRAEMLAPPADGYDLVLLLNVLEHLELPAVALERAAGALRPGGLLAVHVPNYAWGRWFGERWVQLEPLDHLYYLTPRTLQAMLAKAGLTPLARFSLPGTAPWKAAIQHGLNALGIWPGSGLGLVARKENGTA